MDKVQILKRLLEQGYITVDEFVLLYEKEYVYVPNQNNYIYPYRF